MPLKKEISDFLVCDHDPHPRVPPGDYVLYCSEAKVYCDPGLKAYKCRLRFSDPSSETLPMLSAFINLGSNPKPPGPRSRYYQEWTIANGARPKRKDRMSPNVFLGKFFLVRVGWVHEKQYDGRAHTEHTRYSLVREIKALECSGVKKLPSTEVQKPLSK